MRIVLTRITDLNTGVIAKDVTLHALASFRSLVIEPIAHADQTLRVYIEDITLLVGHSSLHAVALTLRHAFNHLH